MILCNLLEDDHGFLILKKLVYSYEVVKEQFFLFMEMIGIEPTTCGLQSHRSPN